MYRSSKLLKNLPLFSKFQRFSTQATSQRYTPLVQQPNRLFSNDPKKDDENEGSGRKVPKGFEKFLKKTKKGINHEENKDKKEEKKAKEQPDDEDSDAQEPGFSKKEEKNEKSYYDSAKEKAEEFKNKWLMQPGGGGPRWGILIGLLGVSYIGWMTWYGGEPS